MSKEKNGNGNAHVSFGDMIFAIIIAISFDSLRESFIPLHISFQTLTVILGYATVIQSWFGYHQVTGDHPHQSKSFRFIVDLIIWFLYFLLLHTAEDASNFPYHIAIYPLILVFMLIWRYLLIREKYIREGAIKTLRVNAVVIIHIVTSAIMVLLYFILSPAISKNYLMYLQIAVLLPIYAQIFIYFQLRKCDRLSTRLKKKPEEKSPNDTAES